MSAKHATADVHEGGHSGTHVDKHGQVQGPSGSHVDAHGKLHTAADPETLLDRIYHVIEYSDITHTRELKKLIGKYEGQTLDQKVAKEAIALASNQHSQQLVLSKLMGIGSSANDYLKDIAADYVATPNETMRALAPYVDPVTKKINLTEDAINAVAAIHSNKIRGRAISTVFSKLGSMDDGDIDKFAKKFYSDMGRPDLFDEYREEAKTVDEKVRKISGDFEQRYFRQVREIVGKRPGYRPSTHGASGSHVDEHGNLHMDAGKKGYAPAEHHYSPAKEKH